MSYKALIGAALVAASVSGTQVAAAETMYDCSASYKSPRGFISPRVVFFLDAANGKARVIDSVIQGVVGQPLNVKVTKKSEAVYQFDWEVEDIPTTEGLYTFPYSATLNVAKNTYRMKAHVAANYRQRPRGQGSCKVSR